MCSFFHAECFTGNFNWCMWKFRPLADSGLLTPMTSTEGLTKTQKRKLNCRHASGQACVLFTDINSPRTSRRPSTQRQYTTQHYSSACQSAVSCCHTKHQVRSQRPHLEWRESSCTTPALSARRHHTPDCTVTQHIHQLKCSHITTGLAGPPDVGLSYCCASLSTHL